jgi:adenine-specific DNA-methyltransferase
MQSIKPMSVEWPAPNCAKPQHIARKAREDNLLVPNRNYVLVRRFSAKEDDRRLIAAPLLAERLGHSAIGLENHVNYIHRPDGELTDNEVWGLAALLNSDLFDAYFRALNGNTQVSATELRAMPLPPWELVEELGRRIKRTSATSAEIEEAMRLAVCNAAQEGVRAQGAICRKPGRLGVRERVPGLRRISQARGQVPRPQKLTG